MSSSNSIGDFDLDKIVLRKKLDMNNQDITNVDNIDATFVVAKNFNNTNRLYFTNTIDPFSYWTADIGLPTTSVNYSTRNIYFNSIYLPAGFVLNNIFIICGGANPFSNATMLGLYNENGTLLAKTNAFTTTQNTVNKVPVITPYTIPTTGIYYCALISSMSGSSYFFGTTVSSNSFYNYPNATLINSGTLTGFRSAISGAPMPTVNMPSTLSGLNITSISPVPWFAVS